MVLEVATDFVGFCGYLLFFGCLRVTKERRVSIFMIDWLFYQQYHFANACSQGRKIFVIYDGDGISELYEIIIFFRECRECISVD